jgi:alkane 1-monooxygenase
MRHRHFLRYSFVLILPLTAWVAFETGGFWSFLPILYGFGLIPLLELLIRPDPINLSETEEALARENPAYDWLIYLMVPVQLAMLTLFLFKIQEPGLAFYERIGMSSGMGLLCGVLGINVGHELGHRVRKHERWLALTALLTSLYMHFYIEHNRGHHKRVATDDDPATARYGEIVYIFWLRSIVFGYLSAWDLESKRLKKKGLAPFSWRNQMIHFHLIQGAFILFIGLFFGGMALMYFLLAALVGILMLETVNYIEHYGLQRNLRKTGRPEPVRPHHSWNSDHVMGRLMLFELSRHSDHHYLASRKYQILRHHEAAPQMPTGYPGMMVLALMPPVWFRVMHRRLGGEGKRGF